MEKNIMTEEKETNMGQQLIAKYLPYWPLLILFILMAFTAAYFYLRYATPIYESYATIIIKDERRGAGGEDSKILESLDLIASKKTIENEIEVLQSRALMEKVVKVLRLYASYSKAGKVKAGDAYVLSPIMIASPGAVPRRASAASSMSGAGLRSKPASPPITAPTSGDRPK